MKKFIILLLLLVAVGAGAVVYYWLHRPAPAGASLVPDSTILFMNIPDFATSREELKKTRLFALSQEPEVQAFLEQPRQAWGQAFRQRGAKVTPGVLDHIIDALRGEVFLAVTQLSLVGNMRAGVIFGADVKGDMIKAKLALSQMEAQIAAYNPDNPTRTKRYLGVNYVYWKNASNTTVCYTFLNTLIVCTLGEDTLRDVIARHTGDVPAPSKSLAKNPRYAEFLDAMPATHEMVAYLNMETIASYLAPFTLVSRELASALEQVNAMQYAGLSVTFRDDLLQEVRIKSYRPTSHQPEPPVKRASLEYTLPDTLVYASGGMDLSHAYEKLLQLVTQIGRPDISSGAARFDQLTRQATIDVQHDLLDKLGPELGWVFNWRQGATLPDLGLLLQFDNSDANRATLDRVMTALKTVAYGDDTTAPWDTTTAGSHPLRTVRTGSSRIAPTYTTSGNHLMITLTPDYARELLTRDSTEDRTLEQNPDYQTAMKRLPKSGVSYTYCDLKGLYPRLYDLAQATTQYHGGNAYINLSALPKPATLAKHLTPFGSATVSTAEREVTTSYSPIGSPVAIVAWAAGGYLASSSFALPSIEMGTPTPSAPPSNDHQPVQPPASTPGEAAPNR